MMYGHIAPVMQISKCILLLIIVVSASVPTHRTCSTSRHWHRWCKRRQLGLTGGFPYWTLMTLIYRPLTTTGDASSRCTSPAFKVRGDYRFLACPHELKGIGQSRYDHVCLSTPWERGHLAEGPYGDRFHSRLTGVVETFRCNPERYLYNDDWSILLVAERGSGRDGILHLWGRLWSHHHCHPPRRGPCYRFTLERAQQ